MEENNMTAFERMKELLSKDENLLKQTTEFIKTLNNPFPEQGNSQGNGTSQSQPQGQANTQQPPKNNDYSDCKTRQELQQKLRDNDLTPGTKEYNDMYQKYKHLPLLPDPDYRR